MTFLIALSFLVACESGEVVPSPSISGIKPDTGPVGTEVTITGTNLGTDGVYATISFGSQPATAISSAASSGKITVQVPSLNPGVYQVSAKLGERSPSGPVKFTVTPTIPDQFDALAPGTLDPNFGVNGVASNDLNLYRWNADSTLDKSFGVNGVVKLPDYVYMSSVILQHPKLYLMSTGEYFISLTLGGYSSTDGALQIWKIDSDGKINHNFGRNGKITVSDPDKLSGFFDAVPLNDGKILVIGNNSAKTFLRRYLSNGQVDTNFGISGNLDLDLNVGKHKNLTPLTDGTVLIYSTNLNEIPQIVKVNSNGEIDKIFIPQQYSSANPMINNNFKHSLVEYNGEIYLISDVENSINKSAIYKILLNGSLDPSFKISTDLYVNNLIADVDGSVVLFGSVNFNKLAAIERYDLNGIIDVKFGNSGRLTIPSGSAEEIGRVFSGSTKGNTLIVHGVLGSHIQDQFTPRYRIFSAHIKY
jgi:hypothetical protein